MKVRQISLILLAAGFLLTVSSCKKDNPAAPVRGEQVTGDLFPLVLGHKLTFNGYIRHAVNDTNITATGAYYQGRMTIVSNSTPTPVGGTSHLISDSSLVSPAPVWVPSGFYIRRTTTTSGDFRFLTNLGRFYRSFGISSPDSLKWVLLVKEGSYVKADKFDESWTAYDSTFAGSTGPVKLVIKGEFIAKETITLNGVSYTAYKLEAKRYIYLGTSTTPAVQGATATIWLQAGLGIVKFIYNSDGETSGFERNLLTKNF